MAFIEDGATTKTEATRDTVFLIGDSIKGCYAPFVKEELADIAEVVYPTDNCRNTQYVLVSLNNWLNICNPECVKVVQFNCGHWDVAHWSGEERSLNTVEVYADNIKRIIKRLKTVFPNAKIVFMTPLRRREENNPNHDGRILEDYVNAMIEITKRHNVPVIDLFKSGIIDPFDSEIVPDGLHPSDKGHIIMADYIGKELLKI